MPPPLEDLTLIELFKLLRIRDWMLVNALLVLVFGAGYGLAGLIDIDEAPVTPPIDPAITAELGALRAAKVCAEQWLSEASIDVGEAEDQLALMLENTNDPGAVRRHGIEMREDHMTTLRTSVGAANSCW